MEDDPLKKDLEKVMELLFHAKEFLKQAQERVSEIKNKLKEKKD